MRSPLAPHAHPLRWAAVALAAALVLMLLMPDTAAGHAEREAAFPDGNGQVPNLLLTGPTLLVCKADSPRLFATLPTAIRQRNERLHAQCMDDGFRHIQAAVDAVTHTDSRILVLPGIYQEEPSRRASARGCEGVEGGGNGDAEGTTAILTYDQQRACPHAQNLITIFGDGDGDRECDLPVCGLQIEGTGASPTDVILDGGFKVLNGIRADRADGVRFVNFTVQRFEFNALYVLETDGFLIHNMLGRWNDEYAYLTFASDHGLYDECEAYGNGDGAVYPGSASDIQADLGLEEAARYAIEIRGCRGHHSALGYSGTAGNAVHAHDNSFDHNAAGIVTDSIFPGHPGLPQDHAFFERNRIFSNNRDYFTYVRDGTCDKPFLERGYEFGVVCPVVPAPVGAGLVIAGGNYNRIENNEIYDNWRNGTFLFNVPAALREENDPSKQFDTSHHNRYRANRMGFAPGGVLQPNGVDFWWDDQGTGNCWEDNEANGGAVTHNALYPGGLPSCESPSMWEPGNPVKLSQMAACATYDRRGDAAARDPQGCDFFRQPERPANREPAAPALRRTRGGSAVGTAVGVSRRAFPEGANAVVVAAAGAPSDALVATPLAAKVGGPLLLTRRARLSDATAAEIERLGARRAYVVGDLAPAVYDRWQRAGIGHVLTLKGATRYRTAAKVARAVGGLEAYVVRAGDAAGPTRLAIAGVAAELRRPILFARGDALPAATAATLRSLGTINAMLVGNAKVLSEKVATAVDEIVPVASRLDAAGGYGLSAAAAEHAIAGIADESTAWVADGDSLDGLAAAAALGRMGGVLVLVDGDDLAGSPATKQWFADRRLDLARLHLVGGTTRLSAATADQLRAETAAP